MITIQKDDVLNMAKSINRTITDEQADLIVATYPSYAAVSPDNWRDIVEDMIYDIKDIIKNLPEDHDYFDDVNLNFLG